MMKIFTTALPILTLLGGFLTSCGPQVTMSEARDARTGGAGRCAGTECSRSIRNDDQSVLLATDRNPTNSKSLELAWKGSEGTVYRIDVATDAECKVIKESRSTRSQKIAFADLADGSWFFCLREENGKPSASSLQVTIDRSAPVINLTSALNITAGNAIEIQVDDALPYQCEWSTPQAEVLQLDAQTSTKVLVNSKSSGEFAVKVDCTDTAGNSASKEFPLVLTVPEVVAPTGLSCNAGPDLTLNQTGNLNASATGAATYAWTQISGPGTVTFSNASILNPQVTASVPGVYGLRLTVKSATGQEAQDDVLLTWSNAEKTLKATLTRVAFQIFSYLQAVRTSGNYAFVTREDVGLTVMNITNPATPSLVTTNNIGNSTAGWAAYLQIVGSTAFIANWERGLTAVNITNPAAPAVLSSLALTNAAVLFVEGNYAYVGLEDDNALGGLAIINITNPRSMTVVSTLATGGAAGGIAKVGNYVYLSHRALETGFTGLKVIDVSNVNSPRVVKTLNRTSMEEIKIVGTTAYIAAGAQGLEIFDVTDPANPVSLSLTQLAATASYTISVDVVEKYAFVTDYDGAKLYVLDVSNKARPTVARTFATSQNLPALWVHVSGRYAYLSTEARGLEIIEVFQ